MALLLQSSLSHASNSIVLRVPESIYHPVTVRAQNALLIRDTGYKYILSLFGYSGSQRVSVAGFFAIA